MGSLFALFIFGAVFYYVFKSYSRYESYSQKAFENFSITYESLKGSELGLFVSLVAKVAKADGRVDNLEAQLIGAMFDDISSVFPHPQKTKDILKQIFSEQKENQNNTKELAEALAAAIRGDKTKQQHFMGFLIQLAFVDGEVSKGEEEVLKTIAEALRFDPKLYHTMFDKFESMMGEFKDSKNTLADAYRVLGVKESDDMQSIKKAYRKLIREYHPDIIKSQNKGEEYMKEATKKTQEINQAYEMIKNAKK